MRRVMHEGRTPRPFREFVADIWRMIGEIRKRGIATLIVDRDYRRVLAHADQALVLQKGLVVLQGTADEAAGCAALATRLGV